MISHKLTLWRQAMCDIRNITWVNYQVGVHAYIHVASFKGGKIGWPVSKQVRNIETGCNTDTGTHTHTPIYNTLFEWLEGLQSYRFQT